MSTNSRPRLKRVRPRARRAAEPVERAEADVALPGLQAALDEPAARGCIEQPVDQGIAVARRELPRDAQQILQALRIAPAARAATPTVAAGARRPAANASSPRGRSTAPAQHGPARTRPKPCRPRAYRPRVQARERLWGASVPWVAAAGCSRLHEVSTCDARSDRNNANRRRESCGEGGEIVLVGSQHVGAGCAGDQDEVSIDDIRRAGRAEQRTDCVRLGCGKGHDIATAQESAYLGLPTRAADLGHDWGCRHWHDPEFEPYPVVCPDGPVVAMNTAASYTKVTADLVYAIRRSCEKGGCELRPVRRPSRRRALTPIRRPLGGRFERAALAGRRWSSTPRRWCSRRWPRRRPVRESRDQR